ncbi:PD40 domain-containing protein, partial [bacterium]|nr:PD40 domain-containing protein [bacterium]
YNLNQATKNQEYGALNSDKTLLAFAAESIESMPGGKQIWLKELTGQKRLYQLTFENWDCSYPVFIDDSHILFRVDEVNSTLQDYYIVSTTGAEPTNITYNSQLSPYFPKLGRPMLNSEKTMIIYGKQTQDASGYSDWEIYTRNVSGGEAKVLTGLYYTEDPENQPDPMPVFVNTGQFIFKGEEYTTGDLYLYFTIFNTQSPYLNKIPSSLNASFPYYFLPLPQPTQFVYVGSDDQIWMRTYDGQDKKLTDTVNLNNYPAFDISGNYIAYSGNGVWVMKVDGTGNTQVDNTFDAKYPVISPDGEWLFYIKDNDIYARRIDKTILPQKLTNIPQYSKQNLDISPDGKFLIYSGETSSGFQIFSLPITIFETTVRVDGEPVNLTNDTGHENYNPSFSPDGNKIVFVSTRTGTPIIFIMNSDGTDQHSVNLTPSPVNPGYPVFNPYGENEIAYISDGEIYIGNIETGEAEKLSPSIETYKKFDWAKYNLQRIIVTRQFIYSKVDPNIPFRYKLIIEVNEINPPSNIILQEILPTTPDSAVDWELTDATYNDTNFLPDNNATTGTLKWIIGTNFPMDELTGGTLELTVDLSGDTTGEIRCINGGFFEGDNYYTTKGDAYITIGEPTIPVDTDENWKISDEELLNAIDYWATNTQIHGWPEDLNNWDIYLLKLIDFWADNDGYEYDQNESINQQKPWWKPR